jgi:hypothetical protein
LQAVAVIEQERYTIAISLDFTGCAIVRITWGSRGTDLKVGHPRTASNSRWHVRR